MTDNTIVPIEQFELAFVSRPWPFASERRAEVEFMKRPGTWTSDWRDRMIRPRSLGHGEQALCHS